MKITFSIQIYDFPKLQCNCGQDTNNAKRADSGNFFFLLCILMNFSMID